MVGVPGVKRIVFSYDAGNIHNPLLFLKKFHTAILPEPAWGIKSGKMPGFMYFSGFMAIYVLYGKIKWFIIGIT